MVEHGENVACAVYCRKLSGGKQGVYFRVRDSLFLDFLCFLCSCQFHTPLLQGMGIPRCFWSWRIHIIRASTKVWSEPLREGRSMSMMQQ